ncbi:MAG: hypothetical protein U5R30_12940 [Deltaproteobacteria bacterium]|nr:hypothetical protein [Deltaproteobacteria bacterium]
MPDYAESGGRQSPRRNSLYSARAIRLKNGISSGGAVWGEPQKNARMRAVYFARWCASELCLPQTELARELEMTVSGIGYAVRRGEIVAAREGYTLIDSVI